MAHSSDENKDGTGAENTGAENTYLPEPAPRDDMPDDSSVVATLSLPSPKFAGRKYEIVRTDEVDAYDEPVTRAEVMAAALPMETAPGGDRFRGTARKAAKISLSSAAPETFDDLSELIGSLEPDDNMRHHHPPITTSANSGRVQEEERNIRIKTFLYAASRENDNDFHLILGRAVQEPKMYMTMELSGLPPTGSSAFEPLNAARTAFKDFFGNDLPGTSYDHYNPPIPVEVEGSLYFDMSHATGSKPGPSRLRPHMPTIWEVHPISKITFEPDN